MSDEVGRYCVHGVVSRPGQILLSRTSETWSLPSIELPGDVRGDLPRATRALEGVLGASVAVLRVLHRRVDEGRNEHDVVWELELVDSEWTPPAGLEWVALRAFPELPFERDEHRELALGVRTAPIPAERPPWARAGWFSEAAAWIELSLAKIGRPATAATQQVRTWSLSSVLRTSTRDGAVYFKATAALPLFVDEGHVMRVLARLFPANVPRPLAIDRRRGWMLLDDVGPELGWGVPLDERRAAIEVWGLMQARSASHVDELLAAGCIDRRPEWLMREMAALLRDDASLSGLDGAEVERLRSLEPRLRELCRRLADGPLPSALVHGDLHLGNVGRRDGHYVFFDWSDASVSHPFLDLIDVVWEEDLDAREALLGAYLATWVEHASAERLRELWQLAEPLLALNQAISYRSIAAHVERGPTQELAWALPHWLRRVLNAELWALGVGSGD